MKHLLLLVCIVVSFLHCNLQITNQEDDVEVEVDIENFDFGFNNDYDYDDHHRHNRPEKQPHIIFILGDDIGWNDVGWHNPTMYTPFMNSLAANGTILNQYYTFPQCTPSRATTLTGIYANGLGLQRGVLLNEEPYGVPTRFKMIPDYLKTVGYETHAMGKWHVGYCNELYTPTKRGFDSFLGFYNGAENNYLHCVSDIYLYTEKDCDGLDFHQNLDDAPQYDGNFSTDIYTNHAVNIIENHNGSNPIFMYVSLANTHFPVQAPDFYKEKCKGPFVNEARKTFCSAMAAIDSSVENITKALINKGMYENSIIIFASDNGGTTHFGANNSPLRGQKATNWDGGARVAAFVHSPLLEKRGYVNNRLIHSADWLATFINLAGAKRARDIDGVNQWNAISRDEESNRGYVPYLFDITNHTEFAAVRDHQFKLIIGPAGGSDYIIPENDTVDYSFNKTFLGIYTDAKTNSFNSSHKTLRLFDLIKDPSESNDIAKENPRVVRHLLKVAMEYKRRFKPAVKLGNSEDGEPSNFNRTYTYGWCEAYYDVPIMTTVKPDFFAYC